MKGVSWGWYGRWCHEDAESRCVIRKNEHGILNCVWVIVLFLSGRTLMRCDEINVYKMWNTEHMIHLSKQHFYHHFWVSQKSLTKAVSGENKKNGQWCISQDGICLFDDWCPRLPIIIFVTSWNLSNNTITHLLLLLLVI